MMLLATTGSAILTVGDDGEADWIPWHKHAALFGLAYTDGLLWLSHRDGISTYTVEDGLAWPTDTYHARGHTWHELAATDSGVYAVSPKHRLIERVPRVLHADLRHLHYPNGLGVREGHLRYVSCLRTDGADHHGGSLNGAGGVIDTTTGEVTTAGLWAPHSPRWHNSQLWVCESGRGLVYAGDDVVVRLPGWTRGLAFDEDFAYISTSNERSSFTERAPVFEKPTVCAIWAIEMGTGAAQMVARFDHYDSIFDLQVMPDFRPLPPFCTEVTQWRSR